MRAAAASLALSLLAASPAWAQTEPQPPPLEPAPEVGEEPAPATEETPATEPSGETTPAPAPAPAPAPEPQRGTAPPPAGTASSNQAPRSTSPPPRVIIRHDDEEEDDEAPEPDPGDPYDILWIELFGGASYVDMRAIQATDYFPEIVRLSGWGPAGGIAAGFRVEFFSAGLRASLARYDASDAMHPEAVFDVGTLIAEAKLALPIPVVQPFVRVGFGFGWHGDSNVEDIDWMTGTPPENFSTTVFGWVFEGAIGLDIYLTHWFAIGAAFTIDLLNMSRQPIEQAADVSLRNTHDAIGVQGRAQGAVSFHF